MATSYVDQRLLIRGCQVIWGAQAGSDKRDQTGNSARLDQRSMLPYSIAKVHGRHGNSAIEPLFRAKVGVRADTNPPDTNLHSEQV